jgi:DNA-directed RNA polymerase subunit beta'
MIDGQTITRQTDELTGLSSLVVLDSAERTAGGKDLRPALKIVDANGNDVLIPGTDMAAQYFLPGKAIVQLEDGIQISAGDALARIPQESSGTKDITGGLPRVADLFEARRPKEPAILAEISGIISFGKETKGKRRLVITPLDGSDPYEEMIPKWRQLNVFEGERVERGDVVSDGPESPHDILRLRGVHAVTRYITNEVQEVYRLQGVKINDKHIEVIVRQMLRKATIDERRKCRLPRKVSRLNSLASRLLTAIWKRTEKLAQPSCVTCWVSPKRHWQPNRSSLQHRSRRLRVS